MNNTVDLGVEYEIQRKDLQLILDVTKEKYKTIAEYAYDWETWEDGESNCKYAAPSCTRISGYKPEEFESNPNLFESIIHADDKAIWASHRRDIRAKLQQHTAQFRIVKQDGSVVWIEQFCRRIAGKDGEYLGCQANNRDISAQKKTEDARKRSEEKYRLLAEHASDVIWILNFKQLKYTYMSPAIYNLRGILVEEALLETLEESLTPSSFELVWESITKTSREFLLNPLALHQFILEIQQPCRDGRIIWVEISLKFRYSSDGEIEIVGVSRNIEERKKCEDEILYLSYYDQLTGLYNRRFYEEELKRLNTHRNLPITIIMADVNGLKLTNDAFGHHFGDRLLQKTAEIIRSESRSDDIIARTGGDEFVILLPKTDSAGADIIINRIRSKISMTVLDDMNISVSFGYATKTGAEEEMEQVYAQAEDSMYRRKLRESNEMKCDTIKVITRSLCEKLGHEEAHCERVSEICANIGIAMEFAASEIHELELLGKMHDIGMIGMSQEILNKPSNLDPQEWLEMKKHPEIGYQILRSVSEYAQIAEYVLCHHERMDGNGYPRNLKMDQIPIQSRILSVAEAYDSMTNNSVYREPLSSKDAVKELQANINTQFDEQIVGIFVNSSTRIHTMNTKWAEKSLV